MYTYRIFFFGSLDGDRRKLFFLLRAIATDDVAWGQNKEMSDPTVALCPRALICSRRCLRFVRVCRSPCFLVCCVQNPYDVRNKSYQVPGTRKCLITSLRYIETSYNAAVSLVGGDALLAVHACYVQEVQGASLRGRHPPATPALTEILQKQCE